MLFVSRWPSTRGTRTRRPAGKRLVAPPALTSVVVPGQRHAVHRELPADVVGQRVERRVREPDRRVVADAGDAGALGVEALRVGAEHRLVEARRRGPRRARRTCPRAPGSRCRSTRSSCGGSGRSRARCPAPPPASSRSGRPCGARRPPSPCRMTAPRAAGTSSRPSRAAATTAGFPSWACASPPVSAAASVLTAVFAARRSAVLSRSPAVAVPFTFTKWSRSPGTRRLSRYCTSSASPTQSGSEAATERSPRPRVRVVVGVRLERLPAAPAPAVAAYPHGHARLGAAAPAQSHEVEACRRAQRARTSPVPRRRPPRCPAPAEPARSPPDRGASARRTARAPRRTAAARAPARTV